VSALKAGDLVLFQGDSITDAGRCGTADGLGGGWVAMARALLIARRPELDLRFANRAVSGDRSVEVLARWRADALAERPQAISLMIGVNDVWRLRGEWSGQAFVPAEAYAANLEAMLTQARAAGVRTLILASPTTIAEEHDAELTRHLDERAAIVQDLAKRFDAIHVPTRETLLRALREHPEVRWTHDGCHPTQAGHALIAGAWLDAVGL
jgi:lysophospholipase L1-like esterase